MSTGLQQIDQDSRTHHETKTRLLEEIFTSSKSGTQSRDSIPGLAFFNPEIPGLEKNSGIAIPSWVPYHISYSLVLPFHCFVDSF